MKTQDRTDANEKESEELAIVREKLAAHYQEKEKWIVELTVAIKELILENKEKERHAAALVVANEELRNAEEKIRKANHLYAFISQVNQNIVRVKDEKTLFRNSCRMAIEFGKFKMAWIGLFDSTNKKISLADQCGIPKERIGLFLNAPCTKNGPQDQVLRTGTYYVCNDVEHELELKDWKQFAANYGIRSCMVLPLRKSGKIIGTFNLYSSEINFSFAEEIKLLIEVSGDISFALDLFEKAKKQKETEEQREFDKNNLKALINNTNDLMWSVDKQLNLITANEQFDAMIKQQYARIINKGKSILPGDVPLEKLARYKAFYKRAFAGETFTETEYTDGVEELWTEISFNPIRKENEVIGTACHLRDITQRKKGELRLENQNKELVKTNQELDRFVYSVSHDLRSPLTSALGLIYLIEKESKETHTLEYAKMIRVSINRLDEFIRNILSYSRNNRAELEVEKISLGKSINEIVDSLRNMSGAEEINFEVNIDERQSFYSDRLRFNTIVENMISNAIKYHKKNRPYQFIKVTGKTDEHNLHLVIEDNGMGIAPKYHAKIFDMFFRLSGQTPGSGVGLYIVKEIIEKLEGSIEVSSVEGKGSSFCITIKNSKP